MVLFILGLHPLISKKRVATRKKNIHSSSRLVVLCHRLVYGLPSTECIALEDGKGKNKKERRRERRGDESEERRGEDRKREEDNAANSRCLLACSFLFFPLVSVPSFSSRSHPGWSSRHSHTYSVLSLFFRTPCGEHELPYSDATSEDQLKQMTSNRARRGNLIAGVSLRLPLQIVPINYDRYPTITSHRWRGNSIVSLVIVLCVSLHGAILLGRRSTTLSANEKDVGDLGVLG